MIREKSLVDNVQIPSFQVLWLYMSPYMLVESMFSLTRWKISVTLLSSSPLSPVISPIYCHFYRCDIPSSFVEGKVLCKPVLCNWISFYVYFLTTLVVSLKCNQFVSISYSFKSISCYNIKWQLRISCAIKLFYIRVQL